MGETRVDLLLPPAMALAPLAVEPATEHVMAFLVSWGAATERRKRARRR